MAGGAPCASPPRCQSCKGTKCTGGKLWLPAPSLSPSPESRCPPCPGVPGTEGGWVPIRWRSRRSWQGHGQTGGGANKVRVGGNKKQDRRMCDGEVGARVPSVPPSTHCSPAGGDGGVRVGGQEPPGPLGLMEKIKKQKSGGRRGEKSRVSAAVPALLWASRGAQGVPSGHPNTQMGTRGQWALRNSS